MLYLGLLGLTARGGFKIVHWTCSRTRLVLEQVSKKRGFLNKIHVFYRFLSGGCSETEVSEQLYFEFGSNLNKLYILPHLK
jgi:hypothetical protein